MDAREKKIIQVKYAICINKAIADNKLQAKENKANKKDSHKLVKSIRNLEAASGIAFPIIQSITKGTKNPALSTIVAISEGLDISLEQFFAQFEKITDAEVKVAMVKFKKKKK